MRHVTQRCTVQAEDGAVLLECGHAVVSLEPSVARHAAAHLEHRADIADAQRMLPPEPNESGEADQSLGL